MLCVLRVSRVRVPLHCMSCGWRPRRAPAVGLRSTHAKATHVSTRKHTHTHTHAHAHTRTHTHSYGAVPVVRRTGGLNDTVFDVDNDAERAAAAGIERNGYNFDGTAASGVDSALNRRARARRVVFLKLRV